MYLEGSEYVEYTPVEAYGVSTFDVGIISGGTSGDATIVKGTRFYWVYDPNNLSASGFTGSGKWYCEVENTPLYGLSEAELLNEFETQVRTNLNEEFQAWQALINSQGNDTDYAGNFAKMLPDACWSLNG
ncbi:hypothetical protein [Sellimonas sp.]|uniref:hypothetical protein n=1 Tax=Sellimonas sp. TaxID=2021466 RepID=UPI00257E58B3|nr:hypothetical protein [Sellimonas sp.]